VLGAEDDPVVRSRLITTLRRYGINSQAGAMRAVQGAFNLNLFRPYTGYDTDEQPYSHRLPLVDPAVTSASNLMLRGTPPEDIPHIRQHQIFQAYHELPNPTAVRTLLITGQAVSIDPRASGEAIDFSKSSYPIRPRVPEPLFERNAARTSTETRQAEAQATFLDTWAEVSAGEPFTWHGATLSLDLKKVTLLRSVQACILRTFGYTLSEIRELGKYDKATDEAYLRETITRGRRSLGIPPINTQHLLPLETIKAGVVRIHEYGPQPEPPLNKDALTALTHKVYGGKTNAARDLYMSPAHYNALLQADVRPAFDAQTDVGMAMGAAVCGLAFGEYSYAIRAFG
jgi:hypothetical protein